MYLRNIVFGMDRRTFITVMSISIAVMFVVSISTVIFSFQYSSQRIVERYKTTHYLLLDESLDEPGIQDAYPNATYMIIVPVTLNGKSTYLVGVRDRLGLVVPSDPGEGEAYVTWQATPGSEVVVEANGLELNLTVVGRAYGVFPEGYVVVNCTDVWKLYPDMTGRFNAVVLDESVEGSISLPALVDFFSLSSREVAYDMYIIHAISFLSVFFLVNALLHLEAARQRRNISIVKAIGGGSGVVITSFMGKALVVALLGGLMGVSLGIMVSYGLITYLTDTGYFEIVVPLSEIGLTVLLTAVSALISSIPPTREALTVPAIGILRGGGST